MHRISFLHECLVLSVYFESQIGQFCFQFPISYMNQFLSQGLSNREVLLRSVSNDNRCSIIGDCFRQIVYEYMGNPLVDFSRHFKFYEMRFDDFVNIQSLHESSGRSDDGVNLYLPIARTKPI